MAFDIEGKTDDFFFFFVKRTFRGKQEEVWNLKNLYLCVLEVEKCS